MMRKCASPKCGALFEPQGQASTCPTCLLTRASRVTEGTRELVDEFVRARGSMGFTVKGVRRSVGLSGQAIGRILDEAVQQGRLQRDGRHYRTNRFEAPNVRLEQATSNKNPVPALDQATSSRDTKQPAAGPVGLAGRTKVPGGDREAPGVTGLPGGVRGNERGQAPVQAIASRGRQVAASGGSP